MIDMDYSKILSRSWALVKKEKILWVFGLILAVFSGGGMGSGFGGGSPGGSSPNLKDPKNVPPETQKKITEVLGAATSDPGAFFGSLFSQIPPTFWIALIIGIIIILIFGIVLSIFLRSWSEGALFRLISEKEKSDTILTLKQGSDYGRFYWKKLFLVSFIPWFVYIFVIIVGFVIFGLLFAFAPDLVKILLFLPLFIGMLGIILFAFLIPIIVVFAKLTVVLEGYTVKQALSFSFKLTKKFLFEGFIMGILNSLMGCLLGCGVMMVLGTGIVLVGFGFLVHKSLGIFFALCIGLPLLLFILGGALFQGILKAFTTANWVLFYNEIKQQEKFPRENQISKIKDQN